MKNILLLIVICSLLSSCASLQEMRESDIARGAGSFQLNPVQPNGYWYNGNSYEYNEYEIEITSEPVSSKIEWAGRIIGTTPLVYAFSGVLDRDEYVKMRAIPMDKRLPSQEAVLRVRTELPRKIHFDLQKPVTKEK